MSMNIDIFYVGYTSPIQYLFNCRLHAHGLNKKVRWSSTGGLFHSIQFNYIKYQD